MNLAQRLIAALGSENERWGQSIVVLDGNIKVIVGDVLLASEFVSYIGAFSAKLRSWLWKECWLPNILEKEIPTTEGVEPLLILTS